MELFTVVLDGRNAPLADDAHTAAATGAWTAAPAALTA
jgi:hypothetical protein